MDESDLVEQIITVFLNLFFEYLPSIISGSVKAWVKFKRLSQGKKNKRGKGKKNKQKRKKSLQAN